MTSFKEADIARTALKIPMSYHAWVKGLSVESCGDEFCVVIYVTHLDNEVRKTIPVVHNNVSIKTEVGF